MRGPAGIRIGRGREGHREPGLTSAAPGWSRRHRGSHPTSRHTEGMSQHEHTPDTGSSGTRSPGTSATGRRPASGAATPTRSSSPRSPTSRPAGPSAWGAARAPTPSGWPVGWHVVAIYIPSVALGRGAQHAGGRSRGRRTSSGDKPISSSAHPSGIPSTSSPRSSCSSRPSHVPDCSPPSRHRWHGGSAARGRPLPVGHDDGGGRPAIPS